MKTLFTRCSLAAVVLLTACSKEVPQQRQDDFSGTWTFKKVKEGDVVATKNIHDYDNASLVLNQDHTAYYTDPSGTSMKGNWQVEYRNATFIKSYSNKNIYHLTIDVYAENGSDEKHFDSKRTNVQKTFGGWQLYIREKQDGDQFSYRLVR